MYFCFYTLLYARQLKVLGGPKRRIFYKIVGIKVSRTYFLTICVFIFQHTGRIFIRYYAFYIYIYIYEDGRCIEPCDFFAYAHISKSLYELHSRILCYPKIKLNTRVLDIRHTMCCAYYDASLKGIYICMCQF